MRFDLHGVFNEEGEEEFIDPSKRRKKVLEIIHQRQSNFMKLKVLEESKSSGLFAIQDVWRKSVN
ncbi:unnamed protein product [Brassica oleracea var. botrytis]